MSEVRFRSDVVVDLVDSMGTEENIVRAARVSTFGAKSRSLEDNKGLLRFLYRESHGVPFESCILQLYIECPVFTSRQLVKHRLSSINESSGRYREMEGEFYIPSVDRPLEQIGKTGNYEFVQGSEKQYALTTSFLREQSVQAWEKFEDLRSTGVAKEVARMILPVNLYTQMYMTINLRSALNLVSLRTSESGSHPQYEVEQVGQKVAKIIEEKYPIVWESFVKSGYKAV